MAKIDVAPLVGAWIEILNIPVFDSVQHVAPLVGAWIEIWANLQAYLDKIVAPLVGAWIEMFPSGALAYARS